MDVLQDFTWCGLRCVVARMQRLHRHLCGYVAVPEGHPLFGKSYLTEYDETGEALPNPVNDLEVHGGITYAEPTLSNVKSSGVWWLGFDCAHARDFDGPNCDWPNKSERFVRLEVKDLAEQLVAMQ